MQNKEIDKEIESQKLEYKIMSEQLQSLLDRGFTESMSDSISHAYDRYMLKRKHKKDSK